MTTETKVPLVAAMAAQQTRFVKKRELAALLQVSPRTLENWQRLGVVEFIKIGKVVLFDLPEVVRALKANHGVHRSDITK